MRDWQAVLAACAGRSPVASPTSARSSRVSRSSWRHSERAASGTSLHRVPPNYRDMTLEAWWDDEPAPSVECPLPDFFGIGHGGRNAYAGDLRARFSSSTSCLATATTATSRCRSRARSAESAQRRARAHQRHLLQADFHRYRQKVRHRALPRSLAAREFAYRRAAPLTLMEAQGPATSGRPYHVHKTDRTTVDPRRRDQITSTVWTTQMSRHPASPRCRTSSTATAARTTTASPGGSYPVRDCSPALTIPTQCRCPRMSGFMGAARGRPVSMYRWYVDFTVPFQRSIRFAFGTLANEISATTYWHQRRAARPAAALPPSEGRRYSPHWSGGGRAPILAADEWPIACSAPSRRRARHWTPEVGIEWRARYETTADPPYQDASSRSASSLDGDADAPPLRRISRRSPRQRSLMPRGMNTANTSWVSTRTSPPCSTREEAPTRCSRSVSRTARSRGLTAFDQPRWNGRGRRSGVLNVCRST